MKTRGGLKRYSRKRLRWLMAVFFVALGVPAGLLVHQAYRQLQFEALHQHRLMAEELTRRIDESLRRLVAATESYRFSDFGFLVVSGDPAANFLQRSPLSEFPVREDLPGVIGHFQVDTNGAFSTPLLPSEAAGLKTGIGPEELDRRRAVADRIQQILVSNRLLREPLAIRNEPALVVATEDEADEDQRLDAAGGRPVDDAVEIRARVLQDALQAPASAAENNSQIGFDELAVSSPGERQQEYFEYATTSHDSSLDLEAPKEQRTNAGRAYQKLEELQLKRVDSGGLVTADNEAAQKASVSSTGIANAANSRARRIEKSVLPESLDSVETALPATVLNPAPVRITTFESEIDPLEFSLLDSGHFVAYRKVWRDGERIIQGALLDQSVFINQAIAGDFLGTGLASASSLIVAYQDNVLASVSGDSPYQSVLAQTAMNGTLLYRSRLSAPLNGIELVYSIRELPAGAGASVLAWTAAVLSLVLLGGTFTIYRLGVRQMELAQQQQDFVSAVSHELKTPLTSIRMYGEILKEGWATEDKKPHYYAYIHDEAERLTRLISNVLQLARITRSETPLDLRQHTAGELLNVVESKVSGHAERAGFELAIDADGDARDAMLSVDDDAFAQVLINLVDNAIKFSANAPVRKVEISAAASDGEVRFSVRDHGPGIASDQLKRIFRLFYRSESELTRETVGTGIGLAIVRELVTAMGGSIDVLNRDPGAEFRIVLPRVTAVATNS